MKKTIMLVVLALVILTAATGCTKDWLQPPAAARLCC
jgi:hypothetical protein